MSILNWTCPRRIYTYSICVLSCADPEGEGAGYPSPPPENSQKYRVSVGSPENHTATKPTFNVGPSSGMPAKHLGDVSLEGR